MPVDLNELRTRAQAVLDAQDGVSLFKARMALFQTVFVTDVLALTARAETAEASLSVLKAENERLRGLLWYAWNEFNAISARSGAPLDQYGMTTCDEAWWEQMTKAFASAIGEAARKPWPSAEASAALETTNG